MRDHNAIRKALRRWQDAGLVDAATAAALAAFESERRTERGAPLAVVLAWLFGGLLLVAGVLLFVAAHWDRLGPAGRFVLLAAMVALFHLGAVAARERAPALAVVLHAVGTGTLGAAVFLTAQIFHLEEHWPAGFLLWTAGAAAAWWLLGQWPQLAWVAALAPAWLVGEWMLAMDRREVGDFQPAAALVTLLAVAYFAARREAGDGAARRALMWIGGLALIPATLWLCQGSFPGVVDRVDRPADLGLLLAVGWTLAFALPIASGWMLRPRAWPWLAGAALWVGAVALTVRMELGTWSELGPYLLCLLFSAALAVWGVSDRRPERINLGIAGFGLTVLLFYFSNVMDKLDRSLSLIAFGALFLALGWGLKRVRGELLQQAGASRESGG